MQPERMQQWRTILAMTTSMQELATQEQWDEIAAIEVRRREMLETFFQQPVSAEESEEVAAGLKQILALDKEVMARGQQEKATLLERVRGVQVGKKASKAYNETK